MRVVILAALAAQWLGFASPPAAAQPADAASLASSEVLFEINVVGSVRSPADSAVVNLTFTAGGSTAAEARAAAVALSQRLQEIARGFGAEPTAISTQNLIGSMHLPGEISAYPAEAEPDGEEASPPFNGFGGLRLRLSDTARFGALRAALEEAGALNIIGPLNLLTDDSAARRAARADALTKARAEVDQFARSQAMRVVRLVRFSEAGDTQAETFRTMMTQFTGGNSGPTSEVETRVAAQVSFALAPQ